MPDILDQFLTPPENGADPLYEQLAGDARRRAIVAARQGGSPEEAAEANRLARREGMPVATVRDNLPAFRERAVSSAWDKAIRKAPELAGWAAEPRHAAVASDDAAGLAEVSRRFREAWAKPKPKPYGWRDVPGYLWSALEAGVIRGLQGLTDQAVSYADVQEQVDPTAALQQRLLGGTIYDPVQRWLGEYSAFQGRTAQGRAPDYSRMGRIERGLVQGVESVPGSLAALGLAAAGAPGAGLALLGGSTYGTSYREGREAGLSTGAAVRYGATMGSIEVLTERIPVIRYLQDMKAGSSLFKRVAANMASEQVTEQAATALQDFTTWAEIEVNQGKTFGDYLAERPDAALDTALAVASTVGATNLSIEGARVVSERFSRARQVRPNPAAQQAHDAIMTAIDAVADNKTRTRDPEALAALLRLSEGEAGENVFIPAEAVASYFQSESLDYREDEFWGDYADQISEAMATGGDVVIPTADAAAHLAGTPVWEAVRDDVRTSPGGISTAEAKELQGRYDDALDEAGAGVADDIEAARTADEPRQRIYQDIRDKLTNAGYTQNAAATNAEIVTQRYATRAARLGRELTGDETQNIVINAVLPDALRPVLASDANNAGLRAIVNVMRGKRGGKIDPGPSLVDWIRAQGGIEDRGGELAAMGLGPIRGFSRKGQAKLIRPHVSEGQGDFVGGASDANSPDYLALRAMEAGYFPAGERPDIQTLLDAIEREVRGEPIYRLDAPEPGQGEAAANELAAILDQQGVDPARASLRDIEAALDRYREAQEGGYQQSYGDNPRGQITFTGGRSVIDLFQARNTSTFIHEMGHQWLEEVREDAGVDGAPDQLRDDWQAVQGWFAANGHPVVDGVIPREAHELWARGIERFVMEGKAPSSGLRRVFDTFRAWLLNVYQVVANLNTPVTPEIRDVMARLLATEIEIEEAAQQQAVEPLFTEAAQAGMSDAEFAAYQASAQKSRGEAHDALLFRTMAAIRRSRTQEWKDEKARVEADITASVNRRPEFRALHLLRTGKLLDAPDAEAERTKIDSGWLVETFGEGILASMPAGVYSSTDTTHADVIAERAGFTSGDEMVRALIALADRTRDLRNAGDKRSVRQAQIDEQVDAEMKARHGDVLSDGSIEEEALAAIHSDRQGEVMAAELRSLSRRAGGRRAPTPYVLAKEWARRKIAESTVQEAVSGAAIQRYSRAAAKAGRAATDAMLAGDVNEAYRQKQAQMLNNALVAEASRMREAVSKARDRLASYARRRTIKSMDQDYLDQIHALLEQVEFRQRSVRDVARQVSFEEWRAVREAEGHDVVAPESFARSLGSTHWSRLTVEALVGLDDTVKQIAHLGRFKQRMLDDNEAREFNAILDEAEAQADGMPQREPEGFLQPSALRRAGTFVLSLDAAMLKMETVFDWLDRGKPNGLFNRVVFQRITSAQYEFRRRLAEMRSTLEAARQAAPEAIRKRWLDKVTLPLIDPNTGREAVMTRDQVIAMALNFGNAGNARKLAEGYRWNEDAILSAVNGVLTAEEWTYVQAVWDAIDTLYPDLAALERRVNGYEPEKVEARPVQTSAGELRGGYYPVVYDPKRDRRAEDVAEESVDKLFDRATRANTRAGAANERTRYVGPIFLSLSVIDRHVGEVLHDITHREAVMDAWRLLTHPRVASLVDSTLGPEVRRQFKPWVKHIANEWAADAQGTSGLEEFFKRLRTNVTFVGLGFRASTILTQFAGLVNSAERVGARHMLDAIYRVGRNPVQAFQFALGASGELQGRMDTLDRDVADAVRRELSIATRISDAKLFAFRMIGYADRFVSVITWTAGYNRGLLEGLAEEQAVTFADKVVRQSQGSGAAKDLAAIQRGKGKVGEAAKLLTFFYSYMSAFYQRQRILGRDIGEAIGERRINDMPTLLARVVGLYFLPAIAAELIARGGPDDDEDWGPWAAKLVLLGALGPIPLVRDVAGGIASGFGYDFSPASGLGESAVRVYRDAERILSGEETKHATRDALQFAGYATGYVPGQLAQTAQFLIDVSQGDQSPETAGEWYRGLTTGKTEEK